MKFIKFIIALGFIPITISFAYSFFNAALRVNLRVFDFLMFAGGIAAYYFLEKVFKFLKTGYIIEHEFTHGIFSALTGGGLKKISIEDEGGSVMVSGSNFLVTLSPYFVPLYLIAYFIIVFLISFFAELQDAMPALSFITGFIFFQHYFNAVKSLMVRQSDIEEEGYFFSYTIIILGNVFFFALFAALFLDMPLAGFFHHTASRTVRFYTALFNFIKDLFN